MADMQDVSPFVWWSRKSWPWLVKLLGRAARNTSFRRGYALSAVLVLLATTLFWSILGARLQSHNADQLSDPYLFSNWATFHGAFFPGSHTFLLKWPIFWLINIFGVSSASLLAATVIVVLVTVGTLVTVLYKIDKRPLVFGTMCLALALALLLIPAQPYAGGILPVNMAMLTTRNLEYAVYIGALILFARANHIRSRSFMLGSLLLTLLIASDKLFLGLSAGGALLALIVYALVSNWSLAAFAARWMAGSILAAIGATAGLLAIAGLHITHLSNSTAATPYGVIQSGKNLVLGIVYAVLGFLTNGGANPAYDNKVIGQLPGDMVHGLWSLSGLAYLVAFGVLLYAIVTVWKLVRPTLKATGRRSKPPVANLLALSLIWSTVVALGVFVATNHYYAVDARYLTISLFALTISVSVELRRHRVRWPEDILLFSILLVIAISIASFSAFHISSTQSRALQDTTNRNSVIDAALSRHKVNVLVGDYWRVLPIKLASHGSITVLPLGECTEPSNVLTSSVWEPDLTNNSFAYLVTLEGSLTNFPSCSLQQITSVYGRPNATQIISGSLAKPAEALLFYDHGSQKAIPAVVEATAASSTLLPITLDKLTGTNCSVQTIMNIVAHEDDDLLFMNPDLLHDISAGHCVRTIFLTAGDSGDGKLYWLSRQLGAEAAYDSMLGHQYIWDLKTVELGNEQYVSVASPQGNLKISLIFFNLPDGNLNGQGFPSTHHQTLAKLQAGTIPYVRSVDGQSTYSPPQLVSGIYDFMNLYNPSEIRTQADVASQLYPDHSDHIATGQFASQAASEYDQLEFGGAVTIPMKRYIGYPIHGYPANVSGDDLAKKEAAFFAYGQYDGGTCHALATCDKSTTYAFYLTRQYMQ